MLFHPLLTKENKKVCLLNLFIKRVLKLNKLQDFLKKKYFSLILKYLFKSAYQVLRKLYYFEKLYYFYKSKDLF